MATLALLSAVSEWPTRRLPQTRFDEQVRACMGQLSVMVAQLNGDFIPMLNSMIAYNDNTRAQCLQAAANALASQKAAEACASEVKAQAGNAADSAAKALASEKAAANGAALARSAETGASASASEAKKFASAAKSSELAAGKSEGAARELAASANMSAIEAEKARALAEIEHDKARLQRFEAKLHAELAVTAQRDCAAERERVAELVEDAQALTGNVGISTLMSLQEQVVRLSDRLTKHLMEREGGINAYA